MKIVKLVGVFAVIAAAIFGIICISGSSKHGDEWDSLSSLDIDEQCDKIRSAWAEQKGWNEDLYSFYRDDINQNYGMGRYEGEEFNTVNNTLIECATNKARDGYMDALNASKFDHRALQKAYDGVVAIERYEDLGHDDRIKNVKARHDLYTKINNFVSGSHAISPKFNVNTLNWTSFANIQAGILNTAASYRNHSLFRELKHIPGFVDGLDDQKLREQTSKYNSTFYDNLSKQITDYFDSQERNSQNLADFNGAFERYTDETNHTSGTERIASGIVKFESEYKNNLAKE